MPAQEKVGSSFFNFSFIAVEQSTPQYQESVPHFKKLLKKLQMYIDWHFNTVVLPFLVFYGTVFLYALVKHFVTWDGCSSNNSVTGGWEIKWDHNLDLLRGWALKVLFPVASSLLPVQVNVSSRGKAVADSLTTMEIQSIALGLTGMLTNKLTGVNTFKDNI